MALHFGLAVNNFGLRGRFRVLERGFFTCLRFQLGLLDLLLLQGECVLHGIGFRFGLQHAHLGLRFGLLDVARLLRLRFQLSDFHFFLLDFLFGAESLVFLFF